MRSLSLVGLKSVRVGFVHAACLRGFVGLLVGLFHRVTLASPTRLPFTSRSGRKSFARRFSPSSLSANSRRIRAASVPLCGSKAALSITISIFSVICLPFFGCYLWADSASPHVQHVVPL